MAHKKAGGSTTNNRDSASKRRGVKRHDGQVVNAGEILVRQKGYKFRPGTNVFQGKDWSLHARIAGKVAFSKRKVEKFDGRRELATFVNVMAAK